MFELKTRSTLRPNVENQFECFEISMKAQFLSNIDFPPHMQI